MQLSIKLRSRWKVIWRWLISCVQWFVLFSQHKFFKLFFENFNFFLNEIFEFFSKEVTSSHLLLLATCYELMIDNLIDVPSDVIHQVQLTLPADHGQFEPSLITCFIFFQLRSFTRWCFTAICAGEICSFSLQKGLLVGGSHLSAFWTDVNSSVQCLPQLNWVLS